MPRITNEVLYAEIKNIKKDTTEMKVDYKVLCEQVNTNRENIASQKSIINIVEGFLVAAFVSIVGLFIGRVK
jgi:hypothetical protein